MNKNLYRIVFSASRNMLIAVHEGAVSTGKGRSAGSRVSRRSASAVLLAASAMASPGLHSQSITPDRSVPGPHPVVGVAANGTPVVQINAPSAAGVSSNAFTNYNVPGQGLVLNNSGQNSQTQIAGWIQGNPFLGNNAARVILNQVTSGNPSTLAGPTEIAGNRANLLIANPAGITCSGCSFIQAPRVTLSTGTPNYDALGNIASLSVQQGQITINGQGLDAHGTQLDLLSRAMAINGAVWAERLNAVAGANNVDYGTVTPTAIAGVGPAPQVAIDVGQLGSMYGNGATRLIGTEQGLGINVGGNLAALTGTLNVAANGDVTITPTGRVQSAADLGISAPNITNQGAISSPGNVALSGNTDNAGTLVAGANTTVTGARIANTGTIGAGIDANGNATQAGSIALTASESVRNAGNLIANQNIGVTGNTIDASGGGMNAQGAVSLAATGDVSTRGATVNGNGVVIQTTGALDNTAGQLYSNSNLQVGAGRVVNQGGLMAATNDATVTTGSLDNTAGTLGTNNGNLSLHSTGALANAGGKLIAGQDASIQGASLGNQGGVVQGRNLDLNTGTGAVDNTNGTVSASGTAHLQAGSVINQGGTAVAAGDLAANVASLDNSHGVFGSSTGNLNLASSGAISNAGGKLAAQDVTLNAASLNNQGGTVSARNLVTNTGTGALDNSNGTMSASGTATLQSGNLINKAGTLVAGQDLSTTVASLDNTNGTLGSSAANVNIQSSGAIANAGGKLIAAQDATVHGTSLGNQGGTTSARNLAIDTGTGAVDNTAGSMSASGTANVRAGQLVNQGGTLAAVGDVTANVASLDNSAGGVLGSSGANLNITSAGNVSNAGGKLLAAQDIQLKAASLGNQAGTVSGRDVALDTGVGALDNTGGAIAAKSALDTKTGTITNTNGLLQAGGTLTSHSQTFTNTNGAVIGNAVALQADTLTNQQGAVSSTTTLDVQSQTLTNDQGKLVSNGALALRTGTLSNAGGTVASNANATVSGTTLDNSAGLMHAGETLKVDGANVINKNTNSASTGMEGANVAVTATTAFDNTAGTVRSDQSTQITAPVVNNTQGAMESAGTVDVAASNTLTNTQGKLNGTRKTSVTAGQMTGDGSVQSQGSVALNLQSDYNNTGTVSAGQDVSLSTTGNVVNAGTMSAGHNLAVSANNITNTQTGQLIGAVSNTLTAQQTLSNDGLIDGGATVVKAHDVVNTGRLYGDSVAIGANTLTNTVNAQGIAGVIASRGDMDLGVQTLNNQEHALIYSAGDMRVGGALDANNHATGSAQTVKNGSATFNADGNMTVAANQVLNQNNHFATTTQTSAGQHVTAYRLNGSTQDIDPTTVMFMQTGPGTSAPGTDWQWLGDSRLGVMVLPSTQYPFNRFGPPFNYTLDGRQPNVAYVPETPCWQDACTQPTNPEQFLYKTTDAIWGVFGITPPQEIGTQPDQSMYPFTAAGQTQYQTDLAAWNQRHDAAVTKYEALNNAITAFNTDLRGRQVEQFTIYDGTQQITRTVVTQSDPGLMTSGGNMTLNAGTVTNQASQMVAGGDLTGSNILGTKPQNIGMQGTQTSTSSGTAQYTYVGGGGTFSSDHRQYSSSPWQGQTLQTNYQLDVSATDGTGPNSQHTVKSVPVATAAGQGNGAGATVPGQRTIGTGLAAPTIGSVHGGTSSVTLPGGAVIRTVVPKLTLPNNALYRVVSAPSSHVLVETDPRFTNYRNWLSSDFMLDQFQNDPNATLKRIGDGFYEQQLIQQEILRATGQRFIGDYTNNEAEYKALLANGVTAGKAFQLTIGTALSDAQMAQLTSDIVWMVKQTVTLPDGSQQEVLVPQVYLRAKDTDIDGSGALMAGRNVSFQAHGDAVNSGTIASKDVTVITADNIQNTGTMAASALLLKANQDLNNLGGHIQADQALLSAGRDVNLASTLVNTKNATTSGTNINQVASVDVGALSIQAGRDANLTAAAISSAGDTTIRAKRDVNLNALRQSSDEHVVWGDKNRSDRSAFADAGTQLQAGGNLAIGAGQDVNATAAYANATGGIHVTAGRDVNLNAGQSHQDVRDEHFQSEKGFLSSKTTHTIDAAGQTNAVGTTLSGDTVAVAAGRDINIKGSNVAGTQDVSLMAKNDVNIESATASNTEAHYRKETQSGLMGSGGVGFMVGNRMQSEDDRTRNTTAAASTIGSTNGNVSIAAGNQYRQVGSNVIATQGDVDILAKKVDITEARETGHSSQESRFEQSGLTVALTSPVIAAMQTASQMGSAAGQTSDARLKMLAGGATALAGKNAFDAVKADPKAAGGVSVSVTVGGSKSQSTQTQDTDTAAGSTVRAGGDARIRATGNGKDSTITVQGSDIQAGNNASLKADGDINLLAAKNAANMQRDSSSLSGGVGVAVSVGSGGASFGVTANASASRGEGNGHDVTWTNTHVNAGNQLTLESGGDTNIKGAVASGKQVMADVGGNLNMESLQDTSTFHSKDQSIGGSVTVGMGASGSVSASQQKIDSDYASVKEQSGIKAGDGGFQVNVKGNTDLKGAVLASTDKAVQDGTNSLTTATLTTSEIHNHADYSASSVGIGGGYSTGGGGMMPIGGGSGSPGAGGVGTNQQGQATTGGDKVPGSNLPSSNGFSAAPPIVMGASGSGSSTTVSGISGGAIHITDGTKQQALTGKDADQTVASVNRNVSTSVDTSGSLAPIFNEKEIKTGFEITGAFIRETNTFLNNRAAESTQAQKALDAEKAKPADQQDPAKIAQLTQTLQDNATWGVGGAGHMIMTALTAGAGGNVTGGMGQLAQNATIAYLQEIGANTVKQIADGLGSEDARAALHAIVGCAGAAASSQSCGAGAMGAAASSVIGSLLAPTEGMTPEQKQARENLVTSLVAVLATATGANAATATNSAQIELENNQLAPPRTAPPPPSPGQPQKPFQIPGFKGDTAKKGDGIIADPTKEIDPTAGVHASPPSEPTPYDPIVTPLKVGVKSLFDLVLAAVNDRMPIPEKVTADNGLQVESNPKHTPGMPGNNPRAGSEPRNSLDLFNSSVPGGERTRYAIDSDGNINRFYDDGNGTYHWTGSTGDKRAPMDPQTIPIDVRRSFGFKGK